VSSGGDRVVVDRDCFGNKEDILRRGGLTISREQLRTVQIEERHRRVTSSLRADIYLVLYIQYGTTGMSTGVYFFWSSTALQG
jgi:hypothetical protein